MKNIVKKIVDIISDYRNESSIQIDEDHILTWINQFNTEDQEFLLNELFHILPTSYLSREKVIEILTESFDYLSKRFKYNSVSDFLSNSCFLNCQPQGKSQTVLLDFMDELSEDQYGLKLNECGKKGIKYWIYFDDVLASGGTFRNNIIEVINSFGVNELKKQNIKIICIFFFLHSWGCTNSKYIIQKEFDVEVANSLEFHRVHEIENNPHKNYYNRNPKFNNVFPTKNSLIENWDEYLESLDADRQSKFAYRPDGYPIVEKFYSSAENRERYESIILNKGIEILSRAEHLSPPIRPLGLVPPTYKTFGTGSHAFTWRNISNTCPIVFWWENHGWYPLFSVENRGL